MGTTTKLKITLNEFLQMPDQERKPLEQAIVDTCHHYFFKQNHSFSVARRKTYLDSTFYETIIEHVLKSEEVLLRAKVEKRLDYHASRRWI